MTRWGTLVFQPWFLPGNSFLVYLNLEENKPHWIKTPPSLLRPLPAQFFHEFSHFEVCSFSWFWWVSVLQMPPCCHLVHLVPDRLLISLLCRVTPDEFQRSAGLLKANLGQSSPAGMWEACGRHENPWHHDQSFHGASGVFCGDSLSPSDRLAQTLVCYSWFLLARKEAAGQAEPDFGLDRSRGSDIAHCTMDNDHTGPTQLQVVPQPFAFHVTCVWKTSYCLFSCHSSPCFSCDGLFSSLLWVCLGSLGLSLVLLQLLRALHQELRLHGQP